MSNLFSIFTEQLIGSTVATCPASKPGKWDQECVRKFFCANDPALVKELAGVDVFTAEGLVSAIWEFDGNDWTLVRRTIKGAADIDPKTGRMTIEMEADQDCDSAIVFIYHELLHTKQKRNMTVQDRETEAYRKTEEWCIKHPPKTQGFQKTDKGIQVVDDDAIKKHVKKNYPVPDPGKPTVIGHKMEPAFLPFMKDKPMSLIEDPKTHAQTWVPSEKGHRHIEGVQFASDCELEKSKWTCP